MLVKAKTMFTAIQQQGHYPGFMSGRDYRVGLGEGIKSLSPVNGMLLSQCTSASSEQMEQAIDNAQQAFLQWRQVPAPQRGEIVRRFGQLVRQHHCALAELITLEVGKIHAEAMGEVQEVIDVCDFTVGLSRQLYGLTIATERPNHRMMEQWHPLGVVGVVTAFNFPMAVWAWNAAIALVCGNTIVWKPSEQTGLCAMALQDLLVQATNNTEAAQWAISSLCCGDKGLGEQICMDKRIALVSATGSVAMGKKVAPLVASRLGRYLLELGGNNAMIVMPSADLALAVRAAVFAAVGTCGQRCTSLRRLICHKDVVKPMIEKLTSAYQSLVIGDPRSEGTLVGPLVNEKSYVAMQEAITLAEQQGGELVIGGERLDAVCGDGVYVKPAIMTVPANAPILQQETFAPLLYIVEVESLEEAIDVQNNVPQGLSSAIFSNRIRDAEVFLSPAGSDCGIANVNIGTSGAEIGGAFGGEKDTGGGRESGSDAWKQYMRRATNTINYGEDLPLAQGIRFE
ncbi:MAG: aldehyde dehydrogenase family protein [Kangiellaceae bacterium]|nr:aldehyde dehydrogenase family protein [Kangiellaceae bacterium]|tara:strand:+ start:1367 stop:2902 length:1536 start_codon:yes stop_codon:yes gene_type:complete